MQQVNTYHSTAALPAFAFPEIVPPACSLAEIFRTINSSEHIDDRFTCLQQYLPLLIEQAHMLEAQDRIGWLSLLRDLFVREFSAPADTLCLATDLALLWADWPLARFICDILVAQRGDDIDRVRLAYCCWMMGRTSSAIELCRGVLATDPHCAEAVQVLPQMEAWHRYSNAMLGDAECFADADSGLQLTLLGQHHCQDFAWQYYDPSIADLCCLQHFRNSQQWHEWVYEEQSLGDQLTFAVLHPCYGFIGSVNIVIHDSVGFCYYWLGRDFRGAGFGRAAVSLLLRTARDRWGIRCCYAKVFKNNLPSINLLRNAGFYCLDGIANKADPSEIFYRWSSYRDHMNCGRRVVVAELSQLLSAMQSEIELSVGD